MEGLEDKALRPHLGANRKEGFQETHHMIRPWREVWIPVTEL